MFLGRASGGIVGDGVATTESDDWAQEKGFEWWRSCSGRKRCLQLCMARGTNQNLALMVPSTTCFSLEVQDSV